MVSRAIARSIQLSEHYSSARIIGTDVCKSWFGLHESLFDELYRVSDIDDSASEYATQMNAEAAVRAIAEQTGEKISGLLSVDLREDKNGIPLITEINIRHTAATSAYAAGGCNMVEAQIHQTLLRQDLIDTTPVVFPKDNFILRDIDGQPLLLHGVDIPKPGGQFFPQETFPC